MSNFTIEIKAPELVNVLSQLLIALTAPACAEAAYRAVEAPQPSPVQPEYIPQVPVSAPIPVAPPVTDAAASVMPAAPIAAAPAFVLDDLAGAASALMDAGKQSELVALLGQFGVLALTQLPKEQYGAFATALRGMGAKI